MAYSKNPFLPRVRMEAVNLVRLRGWGVREAARYIGVSPGTVSKWIARAPEKGSAGIPTQSSRPHESPGRINPELEARIVALRRQHNRCGSIIHAYLQMEGAEVSLATVNRVLARQGLLKERSPWKRRHESVARPEAVVPGDLVELDTVHIMQTAKTRLYVYTLVDVASRFAHAFASQRCNVLASLGFVARSSERATFPFLMLQTDNGSEFSTHFTERVGIPHRHTRVRKPNDNAHVERFNRTLQEECLAGVPRDVTRYNRVLRDWLRYYNAERLHMGIQYQTPNEFIARAFPRS